jgi:hypothetical protein
MSLKEKRNSTISPFSFLMGTMSSRHQKAVPAGETGRRDQQGNNHHFPITFEIF